MIAGMHQREPEALDERGVDVGDEVAEVIDADDHATDTACVDRGFVDPGRYESGRHLAERIESAAAGRELSGHGREDIAPMEGRARTLHAEVLEPRGGQAHDARAARATHHRSEQPVVRCDEVVRAREHRDDVARGSDPRIHYGHMHRSWREIAESAGQPESRLCRPVDEDLVGQVDDACRGEATEDAALHYPDERALMPEVGGDADDARGLRMVRRARSHSANRLWSAARHAPGGLARFGTGAAAICVRYGAEPLRLDILAAHRAGGVTPRGEAPQRRLHVLELSAGGVRDRAQ